MSQNMSSAAVMIGVFRVNYDKFQSCGLSTYHTGDQCLHIHMG